ELVQSALFRGTRGHVAILPGIAKNSGAVRFVYQDASPVPPHSCLDGSLESVINHAFGLFDLGLLFCGQRPCPAKHLVFKRSTMVEGKNVEFLIKSNGHCMVPLILR